MAVVFGRYRRPAAACHLCGPPLAGQFHHGRRWRAGQHPAAACGAAADAGRAAAPPPPLRPDPPDGGRLTAQMPRAGGTGPPAPLLRQRPRKHPAPLVDLFAQAAWRWAVADDAAAALFETPVLCCCRAAAGRAAAASPRGSPAAADWQAKLPPATPSQLDARLAPLPAAVFPATTAAPAADRPATRPTLYPQ